MNKLGGHGGQLDIEGETESSGYTRHSYVKAQLARKVHQIIGRPSIRYYTCYVAINTMIDCPITFANVKVADYIFGKDKGSPVGKNTQFNPPKVQATHVNIPKNLTESYQSITLSADFIFVNSIPFFITSSHQIKFITALIAKDQRIKPMVEAIN